MKREEFDAVVRKVAREIGHPVVTIREYDTFLFQNGELDRSEPRHCMEYQLEWDGVFSFHFGDKHLHLYTPEIVERICRTSAEFHQQNLDDLATVAR